MDATKLKFFLKKIKKRKRKYTLIIVSENHVIQKHYNYKNHLSIFLELK